MEHSDLATISLYAGSCLVLAMFSCLLPIETKGRSLTVSTMGARDFFLSFSYITYNDVLANSNGQERLTRSGHDYHNQIVYKSILTAVPFSGCRRSEMKLANTTLSQRYLCLTMFILYACII